jgi:hypothetical protein
MSKKNSKGFKVNKNIQTLIEQAGFSSTYEQDRLERLVELTAKECALIAETAEPYQADDLIKQYFGVK